MPRFNFKSPSSATINTVPTTPIISPDASSPATTAAEITPLQKLQSTPHKQLSQSIASSYQQARNFERTTVDRRTIRFDDEVVPQNNPTPNSSSSSSSATPSETPLLPNPLPLLRILPSTILSAIKSSVHFAVESSFRQPVAASSDNNRLKQLYITEIAKQMNMMCDYSIRNVFATKHSQSPEFWEFLSRQVDCEVDNDLEIKEETEDLEREVGMLHKTLIKARLNLDQKRAEMAEINATLLSHLWYQDTPPTPKRPSKPTPLENSSTSSLSTSSSTSLQKPRRKRKASVLEPHMSPEQHQLATQIKREIQSLSSMQQRQDVIEDMVEELGIPQYRLEKFLEGDELHLVNCKTHAETEKVLRVWLEKREKKVKLRRRGGSGGVVVSPGKEEEEEEEMEDKRV